MRSRLIYQTLKFLQMLDNRRSWLEGSRASGAQELKIDSGVQGQGGCVCAGERGPLVYAPARMNRHAQPRTLCLAHPPLGDHCASADSSTLAILPLRLAGAGEQDAIDESHMLAELREAVGFEPLRMRREPPHR